MTTQRDVLDYVSHKINSENMVDIMAYIRRVGLDVIMQDMKAQVAKPVYIEPEWEKQWVN